MKTKKSHIKIGGGLALTSITIDKNTTVTKAVPKPTNRIAIFDRSGSMSWTLDKVVDDLFSWAKSVPKGDTVSIGWFSSQGQYRFVVKGWKMNSQDDIDTLGEILNGCRRTVGLTCFSEIIADLTQVVDELKPISDRFTMIFFTDGCPVVSDVHKEIEGIEKGLKEISGSIDHSLYVGYGDYYNRNLMADMAQWSGGALVHADNVQKFAAEIEAFTDNTAVSVPMVDVPLEPDPDRMSVFTISGDNLVVHPFEKDVVRVPSDSANTVYVLSKNTSGRMSHEIGDVERSGMYGSAILLSRMNRSDMALDIIGLLGDCFFADRIANSFTVSEIGDVESQLSKAMVNAEFRFTSGKKQGCVPRRDAFSVLEALNILVEDENAVFYPGSNQFAYKRIGVKQTVNDGFAEFKVDKSAACPMNALVMNETRMNLSIGTNIPGVAILNEDASKHGLQREFPTDTFKNYTIVKDGALNVYTLPCSMSEDTFYAMQKGGAINTRQKYSSNKIFDVNLSKIPVMNRAMADGHKSATDLSNKVIETYKLKGKIKALKYYHGKHDPKGENKKAESILGGAAIEYLESQGINRYGYSPKRTAEKGNDTYLAKEFKVGAKGFSSFPKIDDVLEKRIKGKAQTPSGECVMAGVEEYESIRNKMGGDEVDDKSIAKVLDDLVETYTKKLRAIRREIQEAKFAVLLGNQWFDEFPNREESRIEVDGFNFTFQVKEVTETI